MVARMCMCVFVFFLFVCTVKRAGAQNARVLCVICRGVHRAMCTLSSALCAPMDICRSLNRSVRGVRFFFLCCLACVCARFVAVTCAHFDINTLFMGFWERIRLRPRCETNRCVAPRRGWLHTFPNSVCSGLQQQQSYSFAAAAAAADDDHTTYLVFAK